MKIKKIRGMLILEIFILMFFFVYLMLLINNGLVNVIQAGWYNAADGASLSGAETLRLNPDDPQRAIDMALDIATRHTWLGRPIDAGSVTATVGRWESCVFTADSEDALNAVRVDIARPTDSDGNPTGLTAIFGNIDLPFFQRLPATTTSVSSKDNRRAFLVEWQGEVCLE